MSCGLRRMFSPRLSVLEGGKIFASEEDRQILERSLLWAGQKIVGLSSHPSPRLKPLGYSRFAPGFGSLFVTYRNCSNNCPLALWWGDPAYPTSHPLGNWYPLVQRKPYTT